MLPFDASTMSSSSPAPLTSMRTSLSAPVAAICSLTVSVPLVRTRSILPPAPVVVIPVTVTPSTVTEPTVAPSASVMKIGPVAVAAMVSLPVSTSSRLPEVAMPPPSACRPSVVTVSVAAPLSVIPPAVALSSSSGVWPSSSVTLPNMSIASAETLAVTISSSATAAVRPIRFNSASLSRATLSAALAPASPRLNRVPALTVPISIVLAVVV